MSRYIDAEPVPALFDEEFKKTRQLILQGETHLDNLAEGFLEADRVIQKIPTADVVEVRHGYWLSAYEYSLRFDISEERRNEVKKDSIWKFCNLCEQSAKWDYDYCPNCGAKMDGERSENER